MSVKFSFAENVEGSMTLDLTNLDTSSSITSEALYDPATQTVTYTFSSFVSGMLPKGNYLAVIHAFGVTDASGNPMVSDAIFHFSFLPGDANGDGMVDLRDLCLLAVNWCGTGMTCAQGDFNFDGTVDSRDLAILALNWQQGLVPPPVPAAPTAAVSVPGTPVHSRAPARQPTSVVLQL